MLLCICFLDITFSFLVCDRWLKERESLSRQLERTMRRRERTDPLDSNTLNDLSDQVEALKANIDYIHENIRECQDNIMSMEESKVSTQLYC